MVGRRRLTAAAVAMAWTAALAWGAGSSDVAWDWRHEQRLLGHPREVRDVAFLDDPHRIVVADSGARVVIWNVETGLQDLSINCDGLALSNGENHLRVVLSDAAGSRIVAANAYYLVQAS